MLRPYSDASTLPVMHARTKFKRLGLTLRCVFFSASIFPFANASTFLSPMLQNVRFLDAPLIDA